MTNQTFCGVETSRRHPFVDGVIDVELLWKWKGLTMDRYDGGADLDEHVDIFATQVRMYTIDDAIFCCVFPMSLKESTLIWFTQLPSRFIDCFKTLVTCFIIKFATNKPHHLTFLALVNVHQERGESLQVYMERFGKVALNICNLNL